MSIPLLLCFLYASAQFAMWENMSDFFGAHFRSMKKQSAIFFFFLMHLPGDLASLQMLCELSLVFEPLSGISVF
jgi:hypothetical protein